MRQKTFIITVVLSALSTASAARVAALAEPGSCVVIYDTTTGTAWRSDDKACAVRHAPASTFKIPHALVGLETGAVTPDTSEPWDGTPYPEQPEWQRAHTVLSALRPSVLWFYQRMAPKIGASRMREWLTRLHYGNADTSGDVKQYWLNGTLQVSPDEQVTFLRAFFARSLPFKAEYQQRVREALVQKPGTVQNARGVHRLDGRWDTATLISKTGQTGSGNRERVSWLVGQLSIGGRDHVFASAVWAPGEIEGLDATRLAVRTFIARGLIGR